MKTKPGDKEALRECLDRRRSQGPNALSYGPNPFKKSTVCESIKTKFKTRKGKR